MDMDWKSIGKRIRTQREALGYTRESFAERLDVTPKFCSDIELGIKGMSVPTLCRISDVLKLSVDYILFGNLQSGAMDSIRYMLGHCSERELKYAEELLRIFVSALESDT